MMKQIFNTALFVLLLLLLPATVNAHDFEVDGIYYCVDGSDAIVTYRGTGINEYNDEYSGSVSIPETVTYGGATYTVSTIGEFAFSGCSNLTSITIPNTITVIGYYAFDSCWGLTSIIIPNSVRTISGYAFFGCIHLTSIAIGKSVETIDFGAFSECWNLTSITIPNSVTSFLGAAFNNCSGLTSIIVESGNPKYDSRNNCNAIIETATNTLIAGCKNTIIPNSVTSIGFNAFYGCSSLTNITIPNSVTSICDWAFSTCKGLTSVTIGDSVKTIGYCAFECCNSLTSITIGSSVVSIGGNAFIDCSELTNINITDIAAWCNIEFEEDYTMTSNPLTNGNLHHLFLNGTEVTDLVIPESVTCIPGWAFYNCYCISGITIPNSVTSIGGFAFSGCSGLTRITVENGNPKFDSRNNCNAIIETSTNTLVAGCKNTIIPNSVTSIGKYAYNGISSLSSVTIPNSVTNIGDHAFYGCSGLCSVTCMASVPPTVSWAFPSDVTDRAALYVPMKSIVDYQSANHWKVFSQIVALDFEVDGIWYRAMTDSTAMVIHKLGDENYYQGDVVIPESVTYERNCFTVAAIDEGAFEDCYELTSVLIGDAVEGIGENAFQGCTGLTNVVIGSGVTNIGAKAFNYCNGLKTVTCRGMVPPVMANSNCFSTAAYNRATLVVPRKTLDTYQGTDYWYKFSTIDGWGSIGLGDVNADGKISIADVTFLINILLSSNGEYNADADMNNNGRLEIADVASLIDYLLNE